MIIEQMIAELLQKNVAYNLKASNLFLSLMSTLVLRNVKSLNTTEVYKK